MNVYGFVYIWFDSLCKKFYIGRHWGNEDDGYVCSSKSMLKEYKKRPNDFKRKILSKTYTCLEDLVEEEQKWLNKIKKEEANKKYYNKTLKSTTPSSRGHSHSIETIEKIRVSNLGRIVSEETKQKLRLAAKKQFEDIENRKKLSEKSKQLWQNQEYLDKQKIKRDRPGFYIGFKGKHTEETKRKISEKKKGSICKSKGKKFPGTKWFNNGVINTRGLQCPEGFVVGKLKKQYE